MDPLLAGQAAWDDVVRAWQARIAPGVPADGGRALDPSRARAVTVDPDVRLINAGPGARLGEIDRASRQHGLVVDLGELCEVEVVTVEGVVRTANRDENPGLFQAVLAGSDVGVVTRYTFACLP